MPKWLSLFLCGTTAFLLIQAADPEPPLEERLARHRNLGKAFYENPTTQSEAVQEFASALKLAPGSIREQLNYALALIRVGKTAEGIRALENVQKRDPKLPHTYFNLGIQYKKAGENGKAIAQFEQMIKLVPDEPISRYNLGALYRPAGKTDAAIEQFRKTIELDPNLAAAHFQLFNIYRSTGRQEEARKELEIFQRIKKETEGAAVPEDVEWSAYSEIYEIPVSKAPPPPGPLRFVKSRLPAPAAFQELRNPGAAGDFNNDGLLDFLSLAAGEPVLLVNRAGKLQPHAAKLPSGAFSKAVWLDYDHDYDLDLFLLGTRPVLMRNAGAAGFEDRTSTFPFQPGTAVDAVAFRTVPDTRGTDLFVSYSDRAPVLYRDLLMGQFRPERLDLPAGITGLIPADLDNDGAIDLLFHEGNKVQVAWNGKGAFGKAAPLGPTGNTAAVGDFENRGVLDIALSGRVLRNLGERKFQEQPLPAILCDTLLIAYDFDNDGDVDIACRAGARFTNTSRAGNWIRVRLNGVRNLKMAHHAEVEIKAGAHYQKRIYDGRPVLFGLADRKTVDTVRITWPNGLIQNEVKQPANRTLTYKEAQRLSGSCPIIWTWNGRGFEYITDVLGVAPLGASSGDGQYFPTDHDEYVQIAGESLTQRDGTYEIRVTEELSEVAYLDSFRLIAVDHPAETDIFTNEKFKGPPFPEFRLYGAETRNYPSSAFDDAGRDVTAKVLAKDRTYPDAFRREKNGVASLHHIDLQFEKAAGNVLVLHGWVDWADGSTFLRVSQEGNGGLVAPYLQVRAEAGNWVTVLEDMGMPAGKPKTIAIDLTGKWLSDSRDVRIVTSLCVYWDEIFLAPDNRRPEVQITPVPLAAASLRFRGFSPSVIHPERKQPETFSYDDPMPVSLWNPTPGLYTRYGDVRELAQSIDDKLIVMGSGDEVRLLFNARALAPVQKGWKRDFLLLVDGWAKDRDANTAHSQTTEPLPFHSMSRFPYPSSEKYPDDAAHRDYRNRYNTRPALRLLRPLTE